MDVELRLNIGKNMARQKTQKKTSKTPLASKNPNIVNMVGSQVLATAADHTPVKVSTALRFFAPLHSSNTPCTPPPAPLPARQLPHGYLGQNVTPIALLSEVMSESVNEQGKLLNR